jgi:tryptophan synthase beta subunit
MGLFTAFLNDPEVKMFEVEPAGTAGAYTS